MRAVRLLASAGDLSVMPIVERLLYDERLEVRTEALLYLTQHTTIDPLDRIDRLGEFADYSVRASRGGIPGPRRAPFHHAAGRAPWMRE